MECKIKRRQEPDEEFIAIVKYKLTECPRALAILFKQYEKLVYRIANKFYYNSNKRNLQIQDLISEGNAGLMVAIQKHNPVRNNKMFITASFYISESIKKYVMDSLSPARKLSTNSNGRKLFHGYGRALQELEISSPLNDEEIALVAKHLDVPIREIRFMEDTIYQNSDTAESVLDLQSDPTQEGVDEGIDELRIMKMLKNVCGNEDNFTDRERDIIYSRILTSDPSPAKELAERYSLSSSAIYQLEKKLSTELIKMAQKEFNIKKVA